MRRRALALLTAVVTTLALSCGDIELDAGAAQMPDPAPDAATESGLPGAITATPLGDPRVACPLRRPDENSPCTFYAQTCEYGDSPDIRCNTILSCSGAIAWTSRPPAVCFPRACPAPALASSLEGASCELPDAGDVVTIVNELVCPMTDGVCACSTGRDGDHQHARQWVCVRPIAPCPIERPLDGQECFRAMDCDYGSCGWKGGTKMRCQSGVWSTAITQCE